MARKSVTRIAKLTKVRALPQDGGYVLNYRTDDIATSGKRCSTTFVSKTQSQNLKGEEAWFRMERVPATSWAYWMAIEQVNPPAVKG